MPDAAYYRAWRAAHPEYRDRQKQLRNERRKRNGRGNRTAEYAKRTAARPPAPAPLAPLFPDIQRGGALAFWEDELRLDLRQEAELARLEGRDPDAAVRAYRMRETSWRWWTGVVIREGWEAAA
jgi:hypothetical protein